jgi:serine/threonine protein kinase
MIVPGSKVGRYEIVTELGRGGMGDVFLAVNRGANGFEKLVVVKVMKAELASDAACVAMFLEEAKLTAKLNHPNIAQTNEAGSAGRHRYIAMEFLDGQPLHAFRRVSRDETNLQRVELYVLLEALKALHYAHNFAGIDGVGLDIVHRDATPHNIFVTYEGVVKLVDFGIAKTSQKGSETEAGVLKGKLQYCSPEQALGEPVDRRADIFTIGVVLWEALSKKRMWNNFGDARLLDALIKGAFPSMLKTDVPGPLKAVCTKALALDPSDRYQTAEEFRAELEHAIASVSGLAISQREVAHFLTEHFEDDRRSLRTEINMVLGETGARSERRLSIEHNGSDLTETRVTAETIAAVPNHSAKPWSALGLSLAAAACGALSVYFAFAVQVRPGSLASHPARQASALIRTERSEVGQLPAALPAEKPNGGDPKALAKTRPRQAATIRAIDTEFPKGPPNAR